MTVHYVGHLQSEKRYRGSIWMTCENRTCRRQNNFVGSFEPDQRAHQTVTKLLCQTRPESCKPIPERNQTGQPEIKISDNRFPYFRYSSTALRYRWRNYPTTAQLALVSRLFNNDQFHE